MGSDKRAFTNLSPYGQLFETVLLCPRPTEHALIAVDSLSVCLSVLYSVHDPKSRMEWHSKLKIGGNVQDTGVDCRGTPFRGQKVKGQGHQAT